MSQYKLVLIDLDGTLTPNLGMPPEEYFPSSYLSHVIDKALKKTLISLCTGRDKQTVMDVVNKLHLSTPQIIEGGAKIIDTKGNNLWVRYIDKNPASFLIELLKSTRTDYSLIVDGTEVMNTLPDKDFKKITAVLWYDLQPHDTVVLKEKLSQYPDLAININQDRTGNTVYVTHCEGTKSHGVEKLQEILNISKAETIGIGDGNNDKQLLLSCGFKVAMGNATDELKKIADYVGPNVEDDGVARIIEKFILHSSL